MSADSTGPTGRRRCGVLGSPIAHSLSPVLHRAAYAALELPWEYDAHEVTTDRLPAFVEGLGAEWRGLSLTMPLKQAAGRLCTALDPVAAQLGAVNTMVRSTAGWTGHNTDVGGCRDALGAAGVRSVRTAVIVGAGATAASALTAVAQLGATRATVLARSVPRAGRLLRLGDELGVSVQVVDLGSGPDVVGPVDILVSTIPASAQESYAVGLARTAERVDVVFDVVYEPRETPLLAAARRDGHTVVAGLDLLLHQAARQVVVMTGVDEAPLAAMRAALG